MKIGNLSHKFVLLIALLFALSGFADAQRPGGVIPRQEKLLNGLRVLMWSDPSADKVTVRLRIHAGSAFDPQDKEGVMKLLSEAIFPNEAAREFFKDDLGGSLEIVCNYDYIQITASSKPDEFLTMLETLSAAVANPVLDKPTTEKVKTSHLSRLAPLEKNATYVADHAAAKRLFGIFPYGRPQFGTTESIKKIDFADLRFAYDRLFGADNATIAISGNFNLDTGYRAARRLFGAWLKSDRKVPSTFKQPDPPNPGTQVLESPEPGITEMRYAARGVGRGDKDFAAAWVLAGIIEQRLKAKAPADQRDNVFARNQAYLLPGTIIFGISKIRNEITAAVTSEKPNDWISQAMSERITDDEFRNAKNTAQTEYNRIDLPTLWLDADTYRLASVKADQESFASVTLADIQRVADKLKVAPIASVLVLTPKSTE